MDKVEYDDVNIFGNLDDYAYDHADDVYVAEIFSIINRLYRAPEFTDEQCDNFAEVVTNTDCLKNIGEILDPRVVITQLLKCVSLISPKRLGSQFLRELTPTLSH